MRKLSRFHYCKTFSKWWRTRSYREQCDNHPQLASSSLFNGINIEETVDILKSEGVCTGLNLPADLVDEIVEFAGGIPCYANGRLNLGFYYREKEKIVQDRKLDLIIGDYYNTMGCPAIQKLSLDPTLLEISRQYFGVPPVSQGHKLWWSFPNELDLHTQFKYGQTFHYDVDDYAALKFFFYLTDVRDQSGPHVCILGSHRDKPFLNRVFTGCWPNARLVKKYGEEKIKTIHGSSGVGFVEDTSCLHKGLPPEHDDRLILVLEYAVKDYGMQHNCRDEACLKMMA